MHPSEPIAIERPIALPDAIVLPDAVSVRPLRTLALTVLAGAAFRIVRGFSIVPLVWYAGQTHGAIAVGAVSAASLVSIMIGAFVGGALADRHGIRGVGIAGIVLTIVSVAALALFVGSGGASLPVLLLVVALAHASDGSAGVIFFSRLPEMATAADVPLERANATNDILDGVSVIVGAPIVGTLIAQGGSESALWVSCAVAVASLLLALFGLPRPVSHYTRAGGLTPFAGLRFLMSRRALLPLVAVIAILVAVFQVLEDVTSPLITAGAGWSADDLGLALGVLGLGSVIGAFVFAALGPRLDRRMVLVVTTLVIAAGFATLATVPSGRAAMPDRAWTIFLAGAFLSGLGAGGLSPLVSTIMLQAADPVVRGRVLGAITILASLLAPAFTLASGAAVPVIGTGAVMAVLAAIILAVGVALLGSRSTLEHADPT